MTFFSNWCSHLLLYHLEILRLPHCSIVEMPVERNLLADSCLQQDFTGCAVCARLHKLGGAQLDKKAPKCTAHNWRWCHFWCSSSGDNCLKKTAWSNQLNFSVLATVLQWQGRHQSRWSGWATKFVSLMEGGIRLHTLCYFIKHK